MHNFGHSAEVGRVWMRGLNQRCRYPSCSKTRNHADVFAVSISLGIRRTSFPPVMKLAINFSLTLCQQQKHIQTSQIYVRDWNAKRSSVMKCATGYVED